MSSDNLGLSLKVSKFWDIIVYGFYDMQFVKHYYSSCGKLIQASKQEGNFPHLEPHKSRITAPP